MKNDISSRSSIFRSFPNMYIENHAFGTCRTTKNKKNARSAGAERVKTKKNSCSAPAERMKMKKTSVRHLPNT